MKIFRTGLPPFQPPFQLNHADPLLLIGSCFTEHIGRRLAEGRFRTLLNPNGIVYNPVSIARSLGTPPLRLIQLQNEGLYYSWDHHGVFADSDRAALLGNIEQNQKRTAAFLLETNYLFITLGTARVFTLKDDGLVVANNHKAPANWFDERRMDVHEVVQTLAALFENLRRQRPELQVVLTVSPVRHLRNGFVENQRSKAVLLLACAELCEQFGFAHYFPAYELLLDDLRDYRFFADDMVHPSSAAVDYIWDYFSEAFFSNKTKQLLEQVAKLRSAVGHRPLHPGSAEHRAFALQQLDSIDNFKKQYPELDFSAERTWFEQFCS